jgi:(p)ppGpp synthase/HD superfamily hydrolase
MVHIAMHIAINAFKEMQDKAGQPYIGHLLRVSNALMAESEEVRTIAWLHDILEDCPEWDMDKLRSFFSESIVVAVDLLTHKSEDSYDDYLQKILTDERCVKVKLADLKDNMDLTRLETLSESDLKRVQKYHKAYKLLTSTK